MSIKLYIERVTKQMRNKEARASVEKELTQHFHHQIVKLKEQGATQQEAERKAIELMGNATTLGQSMDQIYKPQTDWLLIGLAIAAILCSFLALPYGQQVENGTLILKNGLYTVFGIGIALLITRFDYRKLLTFGHQLFWLGVALSFVLDFMHQSMLLWSFYKIM
ncbi:permease prefix domain 1-containing protein, partial [Kurthia sp. Dielmo]